MFLPEADSMASHDIFQSEADEIANQALHTPEANETVYQKPRGGLSASQAMLFPEASDAASEAWFLPKNPSNNVLAQPSDPNKSVANPPPASRLYVPCPLSGCSGKRPQYSQCPAGPDHHEGELWVGGICHRVPLALCGFLIINFKENKA